MGRSWIAPANPLPTPSREALSPSTRSCSRVPTAWLRRSSSAAFFPRRRSSISSTAPVATSGFVWLVRGKILEADAEAHRESVCARRDSPSRAEAALSARRRRRPAGRGHRSRRAGAPRPRRALRARAARDRWQDARLPLRAQREARRARARRADGSADRFDGRADDRCPLPADRRSQAARDGRGTERQRGKRDSHRPEDGRDPRDRIDARSRSGRRGERRQPGLADLGGRTELRTRIDLQARRLCRRRGDRRPFPDGLDQLLRRQEEGPRRRDQRSRTVRDAARCRSSCPQQQHRNRNRRREGWRRRILPDGAAARLRRADRDRDPRRRERKDPGSEHVVEPVAHHAGLRPGDLLHRRSSLRWPTGRSPTAAF